MGLKTLGQHVLLNNIQHHDLRLITRHGAALGDSVNQVLIFPTEYGEIQRHYPIFFRQTEGGGFKSIALLGFDKNENLFLDNDHWDAAYVPAMQQVAPFLIGQPRPGPGAELPADAQPMILVDPAHPRISTVDGEPLFLSQGGQSPALIHVMQVMQRVQSGSSVSAPMFAAFYQAGLLAPVEIEIKLDDRTSYILKDMFTVSREALQGLDGGQLKALNDAGFLALAFWVISSMSNLSDMIIRKNKTSSVAGLA